MSDGQRPIGKSTESWDGLPSPSAITPAPAQVTERPPPPRQVGRYLLLDLLGRGGMSEVFTAYDRELDRKIALKLLAPHARLAANPGTRLLREAQALARLKHPNVVTVHDAGTDGEHVFVAMELIEGKNVSEWLDEAPRAPAEVVRVFAAAARGLAAVHAAGLVHRDVKPHNILLGNDGVVRVADFGLARLVAERSSDEPSGEHGPGALRAPVTRAGGVMGTPIYMAPEQHQGRPADAASDQFSFCVALHEALYGELPFDGQTAAELADAKSKGALREPRRGGVPARLRALLLRGLSPEPAGRFPSMQALGRVLEDDPARRRRALIAAAAGALVVAGAVAAAMVGRRSASAPVCQGMERRLDGIWDAGRRATIERAFLATGKPYAAQAFAATAAGLDRYAAAIVAGARDACEAAQVRGEQSAAIQDLRARCLSDRQSQLGAIVRLFEDADVRLVDRAVGMIGGMHDVAACADVAALSATSPLPSDPTVLAKIEKARIEYAELSALELAGRAKDGLPRAEALVGQLRGLGYAPLLAGTLSLSGSFREMRGDSAGAEKDFEEGCLAAQAGRDDSSFALLAMRLSVNLSQIQGRVDEGLRWARLAEAAATRLGTNAALAARVDFSRGLVELKSGHYDEAERRFRRAMETETRLHGPDSMLVANAQNSLGNALSLQGKIDESLAAYNGALAAWERLLGPASPHLAVGYANIASILEKQGRHEEQLRMIERAVAAQLRSLGPEHPLTGAMTVDLGVAQLENGRVDEARASVLRGLELERKVLGEKNPEIARAWADLASIDLAAGRLGEAREEAQRALDLFEAIAQGQTPEAVRALVLIARIDGRAGKAAEALVAAERARELVAGADPAVEAEALVAIAELRRQRHEPAAARAAAERALALPGLDADLAGRARAALAGH